MTDAEGGIAEGILSHTAGKRIRPGTQLPAEQGKDTPCHRIAGNLQKLCRGRMIDWNVRKPGQEILCLPVNLRFIRQHGDDPVTGIRSPKRDLCALRDKQARLRLIISCED